MLGMYFGKLHSYEDLHVILSKADIPPASPKTTYVDIPCGDGSADLTAANGRVHYNDRECTFTLSVLPCDDWEEKKREISNRINGQRMMLRLDKDPAYYWEGRCEVSEYKSDKGLNTIAVKARVSPYKYRLNKTVQEYPGPVTGLQRLLLTCGVATVPSIITQADTTLKLPNGSTIKMDVGTHTIPDFELQPGENTFELESSEKVLITYQERDL